MCKTNFFPKLAKPRILDDAREVSVEQQRMYVRDSACIHVMRNSDT